jgi:hypothetical protein
MAANEYPLPSTPAPPMTRSWGARWPWLIFGISPVLALLLSFVAFVTVFPSLMQMAIEIDHRYQPSQFAHTAVQLLRWLMLYGLPLACVLILGRYAARRRLAPSWPVVGIILTAIVGAMTAIEVVWPQHGEHTSLSVGLGFSITGKGLVAFGLRSLPAIVLGIGILLWTRRRAPGGEASAG